MSDAHYKFSDTQKKVFLALPFQLCSAANSKFSFYISPSEINCIKVHTMSLALNLSFLAEIHWVLFTLRHHSPATEKKKLVDILWNNWYWASSEILSYTRTNFSRLMENRINYAYLLCWPSN